MDDGEQYVLEATMDTWYPCYNCPGKKEIFLNIGEVWKYGYTSKGEMRRNGTEHTAMNLKYVVQFRGAVSECMKEERKKIYHYALLPENLQRVNPLIRPPGNPIDR